MVLLAWHKYLDRIYWLFTLTALPFLLTAPTRNFSLSFSPAMAAIWYSLVVARLFICASIVFDVLGVIIIGTVLLFFGSCSGSSIAHVCEYHFLPPSVAATGKSFWHCLVACHGFFVMIRFRWIILWISNPHYFFRIHLIYCIDPQIRWNCWNPNEIIGQIHRSTVLPFNPPPSEHLHLFIYLKTKFWSLGS